MGPSVPNLIIIFLVILLLFGAKRIPEIARGLGRGIREFKDATSDIKRELDIDEPTVPPRRVEAPRHPPVSQSQPRENHAVESHPPEDPQQADQNPA